MKNKKGLIIEDNEMDAMVVEKLLMNAPGYSFGIEKAETFWGGMAKLSSGKFDLIILDLMMPDSQGLDMISKIRMVNKEIPIIVLTAFDDAILAKDAVEMGAKAYLIKGQYTAEHLYTLLA